MKSLRLCVSALIRLPGWGLLGDVLAFALIFAALYLALICF